MIDTRPAPYRRLLVATDISTSADAALEWGIEIARAHGATLTLVHSIESLPDQTVPLLLQERVTQSLAVLERRVRQAGVDVETVCRTGRAFEVIAEAERRTGPDLVVIGARGHTPYSRLLLGSTADRVVRLACSPVLVVHPQGDQERPLPRAVLAAIDFSEESVQAMHKALRLLRGCTARPRVVLLHASHTPLEYEAASVAAVLSRQAADVSVSAASRLERIATPLRHEGIEVQVLAREGYPAVAIEEEAHSWDVDLVSVGTHGRRGFKHMLIGSVAERVLHHLSCPVLTVRQSGPDEDLHNQGTSAADRHRADVDRQEH